MDFDTSNHFSQRKKYSQQVGITGLKYTLDKKRKTNKLQPLKLPNYIMFHDEEEQDINIFKDYEPKQGQDPDDVIMDIGNAQKKRPRVIKELSKREKFQTMPQSQPFTTRTSIQQANGQKFDPLSSCFNQSINSSRNVFSAVTNGSMITGGGENQNNILLVQNSIDTYRQGTFNDFITSTYHLKDNKSIDQTKKTAIYINKFDELTQQVLLQNVLIKIWKLLVKIQYEGIFQAEQMLEKEEKKQKAKKEFINKVYQEREGGKKVRLDVIKNNKKSNIALEQQIPTLPLSIAIYQQCMPQLRKVLGAMYDSDEYVAKQPIYSRESIFFDRFCFDMISLLGKNVFKLSVDNIEYIFRVCYLQLSHSFGASKGGIKLLEVNSIQESPFSIQNFQKLDKNFNKDSIDWTHVNKFKRETLQSQVSKNLTLELIENRDDEYSKDGNRVAVNEYGDSMHISTEEQCIKPFTPKTEDVNVISKSQYSQQRKQNQTFLLSNKSGSKMNSHEGEGSMVKLKGIDNLQIQSNGQVWSQEAPSRNDGQQNESQLTKQEPYKSQDNSSLKTVERKQMTVSQMIAQKRNKEMKKKEAKKLIVDKVNHFDKNAKSFKPKQNFQFNVNQPVKENFEQMIAIKQMKRINKNLVLNGADTSRINTAGSIDILDEYDTYDEKMFKDDQKSKDIEKLGLSLDASEYNLIISNKIERKTILLNKMQAVDSLAQASGDRSSMVTKQQDLIKKLGSRNILEMTSIDSMQKSLDQYDVINPDKISQFAGSLNQQSIQIPFSLGEPSIQEKVLFSNQENQGLTTEKGSQEMNTINEMINSSETHESQSKFQKEPKMVQKDSEITYPLASEDNKNDTGQKSSEEKKMKFQIPNSGASTKLEEKGKRLVIKAESKELESFSKSDMNLGQQIEQSFDSKNKSQSKQEIHGGQITLKIDEIQENDSSQLVAIDDNYQQNYDETKLKTINLTHIFDQQNFFNQVISTKNKQGKQKKNKSKMNIEQTQPFKSSNNDIKHLSLSSQIDLNSSGEAQTANQWNPNGQLRPMFSPKPVFGAKINRKSKKYNHLTTENSEERRPIVPNIEKLDPQSMNMSNFRKMISQNKQRSLANNSKPQSPAMLETDCIYGSQLEQQQQLKQKINEIVSSSIGESSLHSNENNPFQIKGDSLLKDTLNHSSTKRQRENIVPSKVQQPIQNLEASVVTFNKGKTRSLQTNNELQQNSRQDGNTSINQSLLENSKTDTLFDSKLHNYQCQLDKLQLQIDSARSVDFQKKIKKQKKNVKVQDQSFMAFQGIITSRQIYATNQILKEKEELRKKESVEAKQFKQFYDNINRRFEENNSKTNNLKHQSLSSVDQSQQMSIEIPIALNMKPISDSLNEEGDSTTKHSEIQKRKQSIEKQTGISPNFNKSSRYQVINKKSPNVTKREQAKNKETQLQDDEYGSQIESFKRSSNQNLNDLLKVQQVKKKDTQNQMTQFNLVIQKSNVEMRSHQQMETITSPQGRKIDQEYNSKEFSVQNSNDQTLNRYKSKAKEVQEELTLNLEDQKSDESVTQMSKYDRAQQRETSKKKIIAQSIQLTYGQYQGFREIVKDNGPVASLKQIQLKDIQDEQVDELKENSIILVTPNQQMSFANTNPVELSPKNKKSIQKSIVQNSPLKVSLEISNKGEKEAIQQFVSFNQNKIITTQQQRNKLKSPPNDQSGIAEQYNHIQHLIEQTKNISPLLIDNTKKHPKHCRRMCCVQNELQQQLQIHSRKGSIHFQKLKQFVPSRAPISMVKLDDYNIQSWRDEE